MPTLRKATLPSPRPLRDIPTYQTALSTPATINSTAETVAITLGQTVHPSGRRGRGLPFWLNKERREKDITVIESPVSEEKIWELDSDEK